METFIELTEGNFHFVFPLFFIILMVLIPVTISIIGGWRKLATNNPPGDDFEGERFRFNEAKIGLVNYSNCITMGANSKYLYLGMIFLFRPGHRSMKIPFHKITAKQVQGRFRDWVELSVDNTTIKISVALADKLKNTSKGNWQYEQLEPLDAN